MSLSVVEKPRFRFKGRAGGDYYWEPVNEAARAVTVKAEGATAVSWFWGDRTGVDVTVAAHDRAAALGIRPDQYKERVRAARGAHLESVAVTAPRAVPSTVEHVWAAGGVIPSEGPSYVTESTLIRYGRRFLNALNQGGTK